MLTSVCLLLCQLGACIAYLIFIGNNLHRVAGDVMPRAAWIAVVAPCVYVLACIRRVEYLFPTSLLGSLFGLVGLACITAHGLSHQPPIQPASWEAFRPEGVLIFIGVAVFAMEGINMVGGGCGARTHAPTHAHTHAHTHPYTHAHTHPHTHTHTHTHTRTYTRR